VTALLGIGASAIVALSLLLTVPLAAQDRIPRLEVAPDSTLKNARVRSVNLLEDTPWLTALRQGLPVQLRYRLELWRSREGWFDALANQIELRVVVVHQPLLDQFAVYRQYPGQAVQSRVYPTPGTLGAALALTQQVPLRAGESGTYYYLASLDVQTLSDSDLDDFNKVIRGEITSGSGGSLAERARRLALQLAGLPKLSLSARSEAFEVKR
jgi:hypothetical protein